ncbi:MAG: metal-binding protein [Cyanobacteria bacterium RM1_2_2]|nr:metal-binding protein [Cyanobacteria bacterium RM1_2_2]
MKNAEPPKGRVVWNHSTHLPGLIPILERLTEQAGIQTITPAVLGRTRSHAPKLQLKVSVPIRGGFKLIARKGKTFQEVFVLTGLSQLELESTIAQVLDRAS